MSIMTLEPENNMLIADGDLDKTTVTEESRTRLPLETGQDYTLDLSELKGFDSAGLAYLINLISQQSNNGGTIRLSNSPDKVIQLIELSELNDILPLTASE